MIRELTVDEFNSEFGVNAYHIPKYEIATEDDIDDYCHYVVCGNIPPYFCEWEQNKDIGKLSDGESWSDIVRIKK